ncbi:branched-chain amino acid ABC transporter permease [soil metagenome]
MSRPSAAMAVRYEDELKLFRSGASKAAVVVAIIVWLILPQSLDNFWLLILNYAGIAAIGAIGLNLLTGFTGQVSLGHAFFIGCGAYTAAWFGVEQELPLVVWLPLCGIIGATIGAVVGPFALRLRGQYLVIVTLGLVFFAGHLFDNWTSVTGGGNGTPSNAPLVLGPVDFADLKLFGTSYDTEQGVFWLVWALVAVAALLAKNLVRSRPGRAMQAVRDRDVAAEVVGVSLARYKIGAFAVSSAMAAVAGGLLGSFQGYVVPGEFGDSAGLLLSIQYIAIIIIGGVGTIFGSVLGAIALGALPQLIQEYSDRIPLISSGDLIPIDSLNIVIFGLLIVLFLMFEPRGLAAVWLRLKAYFKSWPFSY